MTILFFSRLFYPHIGGVEKHVLEISKHLIEKGHSVTVLTEKFEKDLLDVDGIDGIKILRVDGGNDNWFKKFRVWKNLFKYRNLIKKSDIIHAHDVFFWYLPFRFLYPSKKIFTTFHGYEGNRIPGFKSKLMHKIAEKLSNGNICVGDFLKKWYGTKTDYVTYGGIEISNLKSQISNKYKIQNTRLDSTKQVKYKILFLGRLEEETGIMDYLQSLKILAEKKYKFELALLGDGSLGKKAQIFCLKNKIDAHFMGFIRDTNQYIANSDFIFTSRYLGILEALSYRKIVFAHYNNKIKEDYLKMTPFAKYISISKDSKEISDQIKYILENGQKRNKMIDGGFNWVKNETWEKMTRTYINLWKK